MSLEAKRNETHLRVGDRITLVPKPAAQSGTTLELRALGGCTDYRLHKASSSLSNMSPALPLEDKDIFQYYIQVEEDTSQDPSEYWQNLSANVYPNGACTLEHAPRQVVMASQPVEKPACALCLMLPGMLPGVGVELKCGTDECGMPPPAMPPPTGVACPPPPPGPRPPQGSFGSGTQQPCGVYPGYGYGYGYYGYRMNRGRGRGGRKVPEDRGKQPMR